MSDITYRAVEVLKTVEIILSEDTRDTEKVLKVYLINTPQISYRDQNHDRIFPKILELLDAGKSVALVSDSGTPLISDPGFKLVRELKDLDYPVLPVPGPSAVISALSVSGLPTDKFVFLGFLPKSDGERKRILKIYGAMDATLTIYESPYRVKRLLSDIFEILGNRKVCVAKDLTKLYESVVTASVEEFLKNPDKIVEKGEYVVMISKEDYGSESIRTGNQPH
jgi:16S rRNA (cytidine1402-2'-O)-methyltransferase